MEQGKREAKREPAKKHAHTKKNRGRGRSGRGSGRAATVLGTILLIGLCTAIMIAGIFMVYVKTTLAPVLKVDAED